MILQALNSLYSRLENDPETKIAPFGYSPQKIVGAIVIDRDGQLIDFVPQYREEGKKRIARTVQVCGDGKRSGVSFTPYFLWDNPTYLLGYKPDDTNAQRTQKSFEHSRQSHLSFEKEIDTPDYSAVCRFLENWNPDEAANYPALVDNATGFYVFQISGKQQYVHQNEAIKRWWNQRLQGSESETPLQGSCLIKGKHSAIARTHSIKIKGVNGSQVGGAMLVSFNKSAYESYGKSQSYNAPVSEQAAFQYCTALNYLLARENNRSLTIGDATVVYWSEEPTPVEDVLSQLFSPPVSAEDASTRNAIAKDLELISQGLFPPKRFGNLESRFYVLGLSPSDSRLSVRFWHDNSIKELLEHLWHYMHDLQIISPDGAFREGQLSPNDLVTETVPLSSSGFPDKKRASPHLSGQIMKSVLSDNQFPPELLTRVLERIRKEGWVNRDSRKDSYRGSHRRAAILKACVNRQVRDKRISQECYMTVARNKIHSNPAYQSGRLLAVLAFTQTLALKNINSGVVRKYLAAASITPGLHLGRLQAQAEIAHIPKIKKRTAAYIRDSIKQINSQIRDGYPQRLTLHEQSMFMLGFYQETAALERDKTSFKHLVRTDRGEWVQSEGERRVANALAKLRIDYVYEPNAVLDGGNRFPDFVIPSILEKENIYIEYLGMQDHAKYDEDWEFKLRAYEKCGITMEGDEKGRLIVIDARKEALDEVQVLSFLKSELLSDIPK